MTNFNISEIEKRHSETFIQKKIEIDGMEVLVDTTFSSTKIDNLISELNDKILYAQQNEYDFNVGIFLMFYIVKHFTDIEIPDDYETQLRVAHMLADLGYISRILEHVEQGEVDKIVEAMQRQTEIRKQILTQAQEELIGDTFENIEAQAQVGEE